jgi:sn-glycerol 3-phosphate transport system ATP-binding protein
MPKDKIEERIAEASRMLSMEDYLGRRPSELSGGQRQRVAIGRAVVREPELFLFDEPLSNLDAALRMNTRLEIARLHRQLGASMIYVTHDQVEAMTMADRMIVMNAGRAEQIGTPLEVYERPQTLFAAQFIGSPSMNVLDGEITSDGLTVGDAKLPAPMKTTGKVTVGIRPEHVIADPDGPLSITVQMGEPLGANTLLHGRITGKKDAFTLSLPGVHHAVAGEVIRFGVDPSNLHFFDPESGARLEE